MKEGCQVDQEIQKDEAYERIAEDAKNDTNIVNPVLDKVGWGYEITDSLESKPHRFEVAKFENKVKQSDQIQVVNERPSVKLDGGSIIAYYTNGSLDYAITRGDGEYGL